MYGGGKRGWEMRKCMKGSRWVGGEEMYGG